MPLVLPVGCSLIIPEENSFPSTAIWKASHTSESLRICGIVAKSAALPPIPSPPAESEIRNRRSGLRVLSTPPHRIVLCSPRLYYKPCQVPDLSAINMISSFLIFVPHILSHPQSFLLQGHHQSDPPSPVPQWWNHHAPTVGKETPHGNFIPVSLWRILKQCRRI